MTETKYLYCINDSGGDDYVTTSFDSYFDNYNIIEILNFDTNKITPYDITHVAIDYTYDPFTSFNKKYTNSATLAYYKVHLLDFDEERKFVKLGVFDIIDDINLPQYKREKKIDNIIEE